MLTTLNVRNFAIIDNISIEFKKGMTVITGETGAGKSLIIDAIGLLFGNRASGDLIRYGETKATIEGLFDQYNNEICHLLEEYGLEYDLNEFLMIKRELYENGKNVCRINNQNVSLGQLKEISQYIGDIHSQFDSLGLINPKNYLSFLKSKNTEMLIAEYQSQHKEYRHFAKQLNDLLNKSAEDFQKKDFIEYQLNELKSANLNENEEEELKKEFKALTNFEMIMQNIRAFQKIYKEEEILGKIFESLKIIEKLLPYDESFANHYKTIEECYYSLEAIADDNCFKLENEILDEERLNEINIRLSIYSDLKRKYKLSTKELINMQNKLENDLFSIENYDEIISTLKKQVLDEQQKTLIIAKKLRTERMNLANNLVNAIGNELADLQLKNTNFQIVFNDINENDINFFPDGIDTIDFLISFNKGEPLKSLAKTASGGELSRFMLSLKTILNEQINLQIKIFDEIDTGISGSIAFSVANKLVKLACNSQVICITHLPQVASKGQNHLQISKKIIDNRTTTVIKSLTISERIDEIASMISEGLPTNASRKLAEELLGIITKI